jgi:hypothetical protein
VWAGWALKLYKLKVAIDRSGRVLKLHDKNVPIDGRKPTSIHDFKGERT